MLGENRPKLQKGGTFEPIPADKYTVQIADVNAVKDSFQGKEQDKFKFTFTILTDKTFKSPAGEETTRGRKLWHKFSTFISEKSYLNKFLCIFEPRFNEWSDDQKTNYNLDSLIGKQVDVLVSKDPSKDGGSVWNNIKSFMPCEKELEGMKDVEGGTTVKQTASVPVTAPDEGEGETADDFINKMEKQNKAAKEAKTTETETAEEKEIREMEEKLAAKKAAMAKQPAAVVA